MPPPSHESPKGGQPIPKDAPSGEHPSEALSLVGTTLSGRYTLEKLLGEGGMGAVYQAEHRHMRKRFAVKVLHPEMCRMPEVVARFEREALAAAHIEHPNIAAATDFGKTEDGSFFLVLEFIEGISLRERMVPGQPMPVGQILHIVRQIANALQRAHSLGIVHRDLKPENVMLLERDGDPDFVKVLDFGIAKVPVGELPGLSAPPGTVLTQLGMVYGTPEYMAPEQAAGQEVDSRADTYALGIMMYEMVCGLRPFDHESKVALMGMHVTAAVPKMADMAPRVVVPASIERLVMQMLAKDANRRPTDALFIEALDTLMAEFPRSAGPGGQRSQARGPMGTLPPSDNETVPKPKESPPKPVWTPPRTGTSNHPISTDAPLPVIAAVPPRRTAKFTVLVASALGAGFFAGLIFLSLTKPARPPTPADGPAANPSTLGNVEANGVPPTPTSLSSSNGQPQSPNLQQPSARDIDVDAEIESAGRLFSQGNYTGVIEAMKPLAKQFPKRSDVHRFLAHSYGKLALSDPSFARDALLETQAWLGLDATAAQDATVKQRVRSAATIDDTMELALAILENQMGPGGADILFDFAFNSDQKTETFRRLASRARNILEKPAVYNNASEALRIAYALRGSPQSQTCEQRHELLTTARTYCDDRCVEPLRALQRTTGCGEKNQKDCWPCLRKDRKLIDALEAASKRPRLH